MTLEVIVIFITSFFLCDSAYHDTTMSVSHNNNISKAVDSSILIDSQNKLYTESLYYPKFSFTGELTGYAGDCALCTGYLACPPRTNVLEYGIYYDDSMYGTVRIVASSKKYQCGTIIKFNVSKLSDEPIIAIILDRGVSGNDIDLLTESEDYAIANVGRVRNQTFEVLRDGWKNEG